MKTEAKFHLIFELQWDKVWWNEMRWNDMRMRWDERYEMRGGEMKFDFILEMQWDEIWWNELKWDEKDEMRLDELRWK